MYSLLQIIVFLNTYNIPQVTILTHFETLEKCEKKIYDSLDRYKSFGIKAKIKKNEDNESILELKEANQGTISYMFCKDAIFTKK